MTTSRRFHNLLAPWKLLAALLVVGAIFLVEIKSTDAGPSLVGPDVTVFDLYDTENWGEVDGVRAYSVATKSCNQGDTPLWWCPDNETYCTGKQHPVIAQNLYRLENGRFEQLGMSWLKHGFLALTGSASGCGDGSCEHPPHGGDQLGIGCTDPYSAGLNGNRPLGMRSEVNATTGDFVYPYTEVPDTTSLDQRIQVRESDLDPALHPDARYFIEGHYIAADDALAGNALNNASYREVTVSAGSFNLNLVSPTVREQPAIQAWLAVDPEVVINPIDVGDRVVQRFNVGRRVTDLGGGDFHYEYAVHNLNSDQSANGFIVDFPSSTSITNEGFHSVNHHSGEPYSTEPWTPSIGANKINWSTTDFDTDPNANALRWGTMFSFWFDATSGPTGIQETITLFKIPTSIFADGFESGDTTGWSATSP